MVSEDLEKFRCCLSNDKHFIIQPITLPKCGHSACKECLPNDQLLKTIKCKKCEMVSHFDFNISKVSTELELSLMSLYENMFQVLEQETSSKINHLKSISNSFRFTRSISYFSLKGVPENQNDLLELKVKYIEDEIDIRIESIKDQLELARENLRNELSGVKTEIKK